MQLRNSSLASESEEVAVATKPKQKVLEEIDLSEKSDDAMVEEPPVQKDNTATPKLKIDL